MRKKIVQLITIAALIISNHLLSLNIYAQSKTKESKKISIPLAPVDSARVQAIAKMLPEQPMGFGQPIEQRAIWDKLALKPEFKKQILNAEKNLHKPFPIWDDNIYLEYSTKGIRSNSDKMMKERSQLLPVLVWAECLENKGRFLPKIVGLLHELMNQKSWVLAAHDKNNMNFTGKQYTLDLGASILAASIAQTHFLLNQKLSTSIKDSMKNSIKERILKPIIQSINTKDTNHWFLTGTNNWTSVCLAGVAISSLAVLPNKYDRAIYVAITERYIQNFVNGFSDDGYCDEGLGYYYYGYEYYMIAREILYQNTNAAIDLFTDAKCKKMALFSSNLEMGDGIFPTIGDCRTNVSINYPVEWYNSKVFGLAKYNEPYKESPTNLLSGIMLSFPNSTSKSETTNSGNIDTKLRSYFNEVGVLICRPSDGNDKNKMSIALVAGSNDESHNHNDVGSFTIVVGNEKLVEDPGGPYEYNNKTFSTERYTLFKSFASFGHPVPVVAKQEQIAGVGTEGKVFKTSFTSTKDIFTVDLKNAYNVKGLVTLTRDFVYDRTNTGSLTITDIFEFTKPEAFEIAFITRAAWKQINSNQIEFKGKSNTMIATITAPCSFKITQIDIDEKQPIFTRVGIVLDKEIKKGEVKVVFTPVSQ